MLASEVEESIEREIEEFLIYETELLYDHKFQEWIDTLTEDVVYRIPQRVTREADAETEFTNSYHIDDNRFRMEQRVKRLQSEYAWSENPPSRPRLHITSLQISEDDEEYNVNSSFLMTVVRGDDPDADILSGERDDTFRRVDGELKLAERTVYLDQVTLPVNLSFFL